MDDRYKKRDATWVTERLYAVMPENDKQRLFPHPRNPSAVVLLSFAEDENDVNGGFNDLLQRLMLEDHKARLPGATITHPGKLTAPILPRPSPSVAESGPSGAPARASADENSSRPSSTAESRPSGAPARASPDENPSRPSRTANGIAFGRPQLVSKSDRLLMEAAHTRYESFRLELARRYRQLAERAEENNKRVAEGLPPLEALRFDDAALPAGDLRDEVRDREAKARAEDWATRLPCWVRVNHGRYSGDVGLLVKIIVKPDSYGFERHAGVILMVARLPEYPAQQPNESYSTTGGKPRSRYPRAHIRTAIAQRLFPPSEYTFERDTSKDDICENMELYKFRRRPRAGIPPLVEWLVGGNVDRSFSFAVRTPWITAEDRRFSLCPKPSDGAILDFDPFALRYLFKEPKELQRLDDAVRPRHMNMDWRSVDNEAAAHREISWDIRIRDRVRVVQGEQRGMIGLVSAVFPEAGVAHLRVVDSVGHISAACLIDNLDRHLLAGDTVSFTRAGDTATGLVVFVDDAKADGKPTLQMAHLFIRPDEPLVRVRPPKGSNLAEVTQVDVWSRTCRAVEVAHDPTVGEAPTLLHRGEPIDDSRPEESDDVRMLDDLHLDLTKHHDIELRPDGPGRPHVLVNGAPLGHKDRVSVERGKLTGRWGVVLDIKWDLPSLVLERYGEDFSGRELVRYLSTVE
jgi:ribosomal protein L24